MRLFVSLSYNGAPFCGWQSQPNAPSVQENLERALSIAFERKIEVTGAGRTDTGVNALECFAHFDLPQDADFSVPQTIRKINAILPPEILVKAFYRVGDDAHARFDATFRTYRYFVHTSKDPFAVRSYFYRFNLDVDAMNAAAARLLGTHDFSCFEKVGGANKTSICTVSEALWTKTDDVHLMFSVTADRFLRNMVRAMVGTLLEVGGGKHSPQWVEDVLSSRNRGAAGQSVPGEALFLAKVGYPYELNKL